jgi:hypothetical protein
MRVEGVEFSRAELRLLAKLGEAISEADRRRAARVTFDAPPRPSRHAMQAEDLRQRRLAGDLMRDIERRRRVAG